MSDPPVVTTLARGPARPNTYRGLRLVPAVTQTPLMLDGVGAVEIVAPDRQSAVLLAEYAAPAFPAELVPGSAWIVRFQQPPGARDWVLDLLALVERWLAAAPLPCAKLLRGGRSYLIRGPLDAA
jgi:hypothetical protein